MNEEEPDRLHADAAAMLRRVTTIMRKVDPRWPKSRGRRVYCSRRPLDNRLVLVISDEPHDPQAPERHVLVVGETSYLLTPAAVSAEAAHVLEQVEHPNGGYIRRVYDDAGKLVQDEYVAGANVN